MGTTFNPGKGGKGGDKKRNGGGGVDESGEKDPLDGVMLNEKNGDRNYEFEQNGTKINFLIDRDGEVSFEIGGQLIAEGRLQGRDAIKATLKLRKIMQSDAATRPNGFQYVTAAETRDTRGASRTVLYNSSGFSRPSGGGSRWHSVRYC